MPEIGKLTFLVGDATVQPRWARQPVHILHVVNNVGVWGAGFTGSLDTTWPEVGRRYRDWADRPSTVIHDSCFGKILSLGNVQRVVIEKGPIVWNCCAQHGVGRRNGNVPFRYDAFAMCLQFCAPLILKEGGTVHMPRVGTGLGGARWKNIQPIVERELVGAGIDVFVYTRRGA